MPILDPARLQAYAVPASRDAYDARDTILYALGVGAGLSPELDETDFVFERGLKALPSMAFVLGTPGFWLMDPRTGIDWPRVLHGEQSLRLFRPLDAVGTLIGETRIGELADKGAGRPAMFRAYRTLRAADGTKVAELSELWILREAGGFGGERALPGDPPAPLPERPADAQIVLPTTANQAALYRLTGDRNPLHVDPATARDGGFERPILHGLCTLGIATRALVHLAAGGDPSRISSIAVRFSAPVYPGEHLRIELWREDNAIRFVAVAAEREVVVLDGGEATLDRFATDAAA